MEKLKILIGRNPQCDFAIENPEQHGTVSGRHATLSETDNPAVFLFEDHSRNGSYVNGKLVHNANCQISLSDHITLGKTYTLPIMDVAKRYFSSSKTTKKSMQQKPVSQPEPQQDPNATRLTPITLDSSFPSDPNATRLVAQPVDPQEPKVVTVEKVVEKVPTWYWGLFIAALVVAFILGFLVNC